MSRPSSPVPLAFRFESRGVLSFVWKNLARLWSKEGSSLDPNGKPQTGQPTDAGSSLDPSGVNANGEEGGSLDPRAAGGDRGCGKHLEQRSQGQQGPQGHQRRET